MSDGSVVVGLFNRVKGGNVWINLPFNLIGVKGTVDAVDLWQQKDLGIIKDHYSVQVAGYGAAMLRLTMK